MHGFSITTKRQAATRVALRPHTVTLQEYRRLKCLKATHRAGAHLQQAGLPADPDASRHLAFGLWLLASGRLDGEFTLGRDG